MRQKMYEELTELFDALCADDEDDAYDVWREDLGEYATEELAAHLRQALDVVEGVEGFVVAAEGVNFVTLLALSDCRERLREASKKLVAREHG